MPTLEPRLPMTPYATDDSGGRVDGDASPKRFVLLLYGTGSFASRRIVYRPWLARLDNDAISRRM